MKVYDYDKRQRKPDGNELNQKLLQSALKDVAYITGAKLLRYIYCITLL